MTEVLSQIAAVTGMGVLVILGWARSLGDDTNRFGL